MKLFYTSLRSHRHEDNTKQSYGDQTIAIRSIGVNGSNFTFENGDIKVTDT